MGRGEDEDAGVGWERAGILAERVGTGSVRACMQLLRSDLRADLSFVVRAGLCAHCMLQARGSVASAAKQESG